MKPMKVLMAGLLVGASACALSACQMIEKLPTWLGGMGNAYVVTITINGETKTVKVAEDAIPEKPADPVREGYDFQGWYLDEACTQEYKFDKSLNADSVLYAYFTEKEYAITCVVDGVEEEKIYKWSQTPNYVPKKDGWVFKSWYLDEDLTEEKVFTAPERAPLTVYAKFVEAYKVNYVVGVTVNGETTDRNETVETELNTAPIKPADPNFEGFDFEGWFMDATFKTACNFDTVLDPETPIYAKLVEKEYKITYMAGGTEDVLSEATYKYWSIPEEPKTPTHNGEYFFGWYTDEEFKNSFDFSYTLKVDTIIYAQFLESKPIYTLEELIAIKDYPAGNYQLQNDITLARETWTPIPEFSGKFDGNGYKIYDFTIDTKTVDSGFFITNNGTIKNLTLEKFTYTSYCNAGTANVGVLVAINNGTVENCTVNNLQVNNNGGITYKNSITSSGGTYYAYYGGLIAKNNANGIVKNCDVIVDIVYDGYLKAAYNNEYYGCSFTLRSYLGGAIAKNDGTVSNVSATMNVVRPPLSDGSKGYTAGSYGQWGNASDRHDQSSFCFYVGGVVSINSGAIEKCDATLDVDIACTNDTYGHPYVYVGGLVEENSGTVKESVARGKIVNAGSGAEVHIGGFIRYNSNLISDCYSDVEITTNTCGGMLGGFIAQNAATVERSYALGSITSTSTGNYVGGFAGYCETNAQIKNSFTAVDITAATSKMGAFIGELVVGASTFSYCYYASDATVMKGEEAFTSTIVSGVNTETTANMYTQAFLTDLYWNYKVQAWKIDGTNAPSLLWETANA